MKNILIINGHPDKESFCSSIAEKYHQGAKATGANSTVVHLVDLKFNPILQFGYRQRTELEADLLEVREAISAADHLVFVYPIWWGVQPALLKGFIDRVFLPGFAFKPKEDSVMWDKLLKGKTGRIITTMDAPNWYNKLMYRNAGIHAMKKATLEYCGVKPVKTTTFSLVKHSDFSKREDWLKKVEKLGRSMN